MRQTQRNGNTAWSRTPLRCLLAACALASPAWSPARAALVLSDTRLVYHAAAHEAWIGVLNVGKKPALMQVWIDAGNASAKPQDTKVPFVVTPPMARIDPGQRQTISVVFTGAKLASDRESLYWLNVLDIPPEPHLRPGTNYIQFAVRTRIKLLYRPVSLHGDPGQAMASLHWSERCKAGKCSLRVRNPSPYYIAIVDLRGGARSQRTALQGTAPPFGSMHWPLHRTWARAPVRTVSYGVLNDDGAMISAHASVARTP